MDIVQQANGRSGCVCYNPVLLMKTTQTAEEYDWVKTQNEHLNKFAFPGHQYALIGNTEQIVPTQGLTKREYFAAMAMQGLLAPGVFQAPTDYEYTATLAIRMADELLKQLNEK